MEEKLRIYDNRDRVIIELKQTLWDLCQSIIEFMQILWELCQSHISLLFVLTFIFSIAAHAIFSTIFSIIELRLVSRITILLDLLVWLLLIFRLFCRNTSITINRSSKKIIVKSHYQIATLVRYSETLERLLTKILSSATDMEFTESEADFTLKDNDTPRDSHSPLNY